MELVVVIFFVVLIALLLKLIHGKRSAPGPWGLPLVGYYPFIQKEPLSVAKKLTERYGRIFQINLLGQPVYFLNDLEIVREAFITKGDFTSGRPEGFTLIKTPTLKAASILNGSTWSIQRKATLKALSELSAGERAMENYLTWECESLVQKVKDVLGMDYDYLELLTHFSITTSTLFLFGKRFNADDPMYIAIRDDARRLVGAIPGMHGFCSGPLFYLLCRVQGTNLKAMRELGLRSTRIFAGFVKERIANFTEGQVNDVLDFYVQKHLDEKQHPVESKAFDEEAIADNIFDNFFGSAESVPQLLYYGLRLLTLYPDVQAKVQKEIDEIIGKERLVSQSDRSLLNYTRAVIHEIQRVALQNPFMMLHTTTGDITLGGYHIPRGSSILVNNASISRDKAYFKNPDQFDPRNFLDENGHYKKNEAFIPFSMGPRVCTGFRFARLQVFICFVTLLQKFRWEASEEAKMVEKLRDTGFPRPGKQTVKATLRS